MTRPTTQHHESLESRRLLSSTLSIGSTIDTAYRDTGEQGLIVVTRRGDLSEPMTVPLSVGGSAENGVDYGRVGSEVVIPAGERSVGLPIRVPGNGNPSSYVRLTLGDVPGVRYGSRTATVDLLSSPLASRP